MRHNFSEIKPVNYLRARNVKEPKSAATCFENTDCVGGVY